MVGERQGRYPEASHVARYQFSAKSIKKGDQVLDVFCGSGYGTRILAQTGAHVLGFDRFNGRPSTDKITFMKSAFPETHLNPHSFDVAVAFEAIEHIRPKLGAELLRSIRFWLKQGGTLWLSTPNADVIPYSKERYPFHFLHYTHAELEDLLFKAGFDNVKWFNQEKKGSVQFRDGPKGTYMIAKVT